MSYKVVSRAVLGGALSLGVLSCQAPLTQPVTPPDAPSSLGKPESPMVKVTFTISPHQSFSLKQTAQAQAVKLVLNDGTTTYFANNVDQNGFAYVASGSSNITLTANVPEDALYTAKLGFYSSGTEGGLITEINAAFRTPATGNVNINQRTTITGRLVAEIRENHASYLTNLDLNALQSFVDGFLGLDNGSFTNLGIHKFSPRTPQEVDITQMAFDIVDNVLSPLNDTVGDAAAKGDYRYLKMPYAIGARELVYLDNNKGLRHVMAATSDRKMFMYNVQNKRLIGLQPDSNGELEKSQPDTRLLFDVNAAGTSGQHGSVGLDEMQSPFLVAGFTNHNGTSTPVFYHISQTDPFTDKSRLIARSQSNGNILWSYDFGGQSTDVDPNFSPVLQSSIDPNCGCVADIIYVPYSAKSPGAARMVKLRSRTMPTLENTYTYSGTRTPMNVNGSGALSPDGSKLYIVNGGSRQSAELIVLNTSDMSLLRITDLGAYGVYPDKSSPVVAADGSVYLTTFLYSSGSYQGAYLHAFHADGTQKWNTPFTLDNSAGARIEYSPVIETVNGNNRLYASTSISDTTVNYGVMHAVEDSGTSGSRLWQQNVGFEMRPEPMLAEHSDGSTVVLAGSELSPRVYMFNAATGTIRDSFFPGGNYTTGFALYDKQIFLGTNDVDRSYLRAYQYPIKGLLPPSRSSWPKVGGDIANSGQPRLVN